MNRILIASFAMTATLGCLGAEQQRRRAYDYQYQQAVQLCGRPDAAFQAGYNAGYNGERMGADWTAMCTPDVREQSFTGYQTGFLQGANNAPIRVVHTVTPVRTTTHTIVTQPAVASCTFDSDCGGGGWHCRSGSCMGYGVIGDQCVFNEDCSNDHCFGGTCRE